jgi:TonB family protein
MKINEVEAAVGVTKKNIRFYEEEGLITPSREPGNGYRSYSQADVERLRRIKLLRKLDVPLAEIREMLEGQKTLAEGMAQQLERLSTRRKDLDEAIGFCTVLEKASGSKNFRLELMGGSNYSQTQLLAIQKELNKKMEESGYENIKRNVTGYGVGLRHIEIRLIVNTPEKQKEFREKIMDSPAFQFSGVTEPIINQKVGVNHINGIYIRPEYPVFSTKALHATFILSNHSGGDLICGEHYYLTFEDEKGTWRELPINAAFWDIAYVLRDGEERVMKASLYPDVHPNKPGRYRYFYEITIRRKPVLMMAEFRLTDNEEEWRTAEKTSLPPYVSDAGKGGSPQLITEEPMEEPVYKVVEVMPEFPGGMKALMDFIQKNIRYPEEARKNGIQGRVAVSVVIDENGRVTAPVIMRSRYPALDEEALRIVELMPQWKPGMQQGKAVKVEFTFPVTFKLE